MGTIMVKIKNRLKTTQLGTYVRNYRWNKAILSRENAIKTVERFAGDVDSREKELLVNDILDVAKKYRFSANEYFYYHFRDKDETERKSFISDLNRIVFCERLNDPKNLPIFDDKSKTYEIFGKYYKRDVCCVKGAKDAKAFSGFVDKHNRFILKPISDSCGRGIKIIDLSEESCNENKLSLLVNEYCKKVGSFIAEEIIVQVPEMAKFHPASLNTVRIATVLYDDGPEIIAAFMRTGRGDSIVDNAGAGGVFGTIDISNGSILAVGDEFGKSYTCHPDTGEQMVGFEIPHWGEAVELGKALAKVVKGNRYAGWDLALTDRGWVMVEGNARGQFVWQIPIQKGFMTQANMILERLGLKKINKLGV